VTYLFSSPHFAIKKVEFSPTVHLERQELIRLAGLKPGINIFRASPGHIAKRLKKHPWVLAAAVSRVLPDKLRIHITEHEARAAVLFSQKALNCKRGEPCAQTPFYLVNQHGEVFKRALPSELQGKVIITGIPRSQYLKDPHATRRRLQRALELFASYQKNPQRPAISELYLQGDMITLFLKKSGTAIHLDILRFTTLVATLDSFLGGVDQKLDQFSEVYMDNRENPDRIVCIPRVLPSPALESTPENAKIEKKNATGQAGKRLTASKHSAAPKLKKSKSINRKLAKASLRKKRPLHTPPKKGKSQVSSIH
ncbi:FtsQ-type POTRA domain-containing protein, partial [Myxococcota bacterium]|nr:FtsQ-type POTRA domain-containing protein [Myxococcota bacterium]